MMKCIICGCTERSACRNSALGPCAWHSPDLCEYCANPGLFETTIRPIENLRSMDALTSARLRMALRKMNINVVVKADNKNDLRIYLRETEASRSHITRYMFLRILFVWFPNGIRNPPGDELSVSVKLNEFQPLIELAQHGG